MQKIEKALQIGLGAACFCPSSTSEDVKLIQEAQQELAELKERLRGIKTVTSMASYEEFCPACRETDGNHKPDCWLHAAISKSKTNDNLEEQASE